MFFPVVCSLAIAGIVITIVTFIFSGLSNPTLSTQSSLQYLPIPSELGPPSNQTTYLGVPTRSGWDRYKVSR